MDIWTPSVTTHGHVLADAPEAHEVDWLLIGCHGYAQNAEHALQMVQDIALPGDALRLGAQGLHRFYGKGTGGRIAASWMTREDRDLAIADNLAYLDAIVATAAADYRWQRLAIIGFSQGAAMAMRAGAHWGRDRCQAVIAVGGDVPPDIHDDLNQDYPPLLLIRGEEDQAYNAEKFTADQELLAQRRVEARGETVVGGHEWNDAIARMVMTFLDR